MIFTKRIRHGVQQTVGFTGIIFTTNQNDTGGVPVAFQKNYLGATGQIP